MWILQRSHWYRVGKFQRQLSRPAGFSWVTRRNKMEEILPQTIFLCYIETLAIFPSLIKSTPEMAFPMECSGTFCAPQTAPVLSPVPGYNHRLWTQPASKTLLLNGPVVQHTLDPQIRKGISQFNWLKVHLKFVTWPFPHQYFPENCFSS